jgi:hypothetical protein
MSVDGNMSEYKWWARKFHGRAKEILKERSANDRFFNNIEKYIELAESPDEILEMLLDVVINLRESNAAILKRVIEL